MKLAAQRPWVENGVVQLRRVRNDNQLTREQVIIVAEFSFRQARVERGTRTSSANVPASALKLKCCQLERCTYTVDWTCTSLSQGSRPHCKVTEQTLSSRMSTETMLELPIFGAQRMNPRCYR